MELINLTHGKAINYTKICEGINARTHHHKIWLCPYIKGTTMSTVKLKRADTYKQELRACFFSDLS